jgi:HD superfamily phosphohydrolase
LYLHPYISTGEDMTKEALKLALEALEHEAKIGNDDAYKLERDAIKEALAQPEQEPVAWRYRMSVEDGYWVWNYATYIERQKDDRCEPLYTTPPQRTWVGLTNDELTDLFYNKNLGQESAVSQAIALLKERNT